MTGISHPALSHGAEYYPAPPKHVPPPAVGVTREPMHAASEQLTPRNPAQEGAAERNRVEGGTRPEPRPASAPSLPLARVPVRQSGTGPRLFLRYLFACGAGPQQSEPELAPAARSSREAGRAAPGPSISGCSAAASLLAAPPGTGQASGKARSGRPGAVGWPRAFPLREPSAPLVFARAAGLAGGQRGGGRGAALSGVLGSLVPGHPAFLLGLQPGGSQTWSIPVSFHPALGKVLFCGSKPS